MWPGLVRCYVALVSVPRVIWGRRWNIIWWWLWIGRSRWLIFVLVSSFTTDGTPSSPPLWRVYRRWASTLRSEEDLPVGFHCTIVFWARRDILVLRLFIIFSFHCISRLRCCWVWSCTNTDCVGVLLFPSKFLCRAACAGGWCCRARSEVASAAGGDLGVNYCHSNNLCAVYHPTWMVVMTGGEPHAPCQKLVKTNLINISQDPKYGLNHSQPHTLLFKTIGFDLLCMNQCNYSWFRAGERIYEKSRTLSYFYHSLFLTFAW